MNCPDTASRIADKLMSDINRLFMLLVKFSFVCNSLVLYFTILTTPCAYANIESIELFMLAQFTYAN